MEEGHSASLPVLGCCRLDPTRESYQSIMVEEKTLSVLLKDVVGLN
jgi:hypothetical protein